MKMWEINSEDIQAGAWDAFINASAQGAPFMLYDWMQASAPGWKALVFEAEGKWIAVMPLRIRRKYFWNISLQPLYSQHWGPCFQEDLDSKIQSEILKSVFYYLQDRTHYFSWCFSPNVCIPSDFISVPGVQIKYKTTYRLSLTEDPLSGLSSTAGRQKRKAERAGFIQSKQFEAEACAKILRMNPHIMPASEIPGFIALAQAGIDKQDIEVFMYKDKSGKYIAFGLFLKSAHTTYYWAGAILPEYRNSGLMTLLMTEGILNARKLYCTIFDFEGSEIPSIAKFFKGFGAQAFVYICIYGNRLPRWIQWINK